jgi:DNA-binding NtrC family response regulator
MTKLIIIDDEPQITAMLEKWFRKSGTYEVCGFTDLATAVKELASINPDVILLDVMMTPIDDVETLTKIKELAPTSKVIMMTAYSTLDKVFKAQQNGADSYLLKPFDSLAAIEQKVQEALK